MEDHVLGTFKQVARNIITCVQREPCMPANDHGKWSLPAALVYGCDLMRSTVPTDMLAKYLGLDYVSKEIQSQVPWHILETLGVSKLSVEQLVDIARSVLKEAQDTSSNMELRGWAGKWLAIVYKTLQETCDYSTDTIKLVRSLCIFPLCDGSFVSLEKDVVFFPVDTNTKTRKGTYASCTCLNVQAEIALIFAEYTFL